jgi:putative Holliday junction resolvase
MTRLIGIDHGSRRIGLAVGDTETGMAFARGALRTGSRAAALDQLVRLASAERAERFVLGLPLHADGTEGEQAARARDFGLALAQASNLPVSFVDERLTSWQAGEQLSDAGRHPKRRTGELDAAAARLILQQYLDDLASRGSAGTHPTPDSEEPA